jgi:hypothetical protein
LYVITVTGPKMATPMITATGPKMATRMITVTGPKMATRTRRRHWTSSSNSGWTACWMASRAHRQSVTSDRRGR